MGGGREWGGNRSIRMPNHADKSHKLRSALNPEFLIAGDNHPILALPLYTPCTAKLSVILLYSHSNLEQEPLPITADHPFL